jgi:hypothetical protein
VVRKNPMQDLAKLTTLGAHLRFREVSAIALRGGKAESVLDKEYRMIDASYLDSVSSNILRQRERLLSLEGSD